MTNPTDLIHTHAEIPGPDDPLMAACDAVRARFADLSSGRPPQQTSRTPDVQYLIVPGVRDGFMEAFGVLGSCIGEEGDWVLLGHVEPRKAIAAWWRMNRDGLGLDRSDLFGLSAGDRAPSWDALLAGVTHEHAFFEIHTTACQCGCEPDAFWCRVAPEGAHGALPVTWISEICP